MNFEKISFKQYENDVNNHCDVPKQYEDIKLPKRATMGSAGYDFFAPFGFELRAGECITIPTGIRVLLDNENIDLVGYKDILDMILSLSPLRISTILTNAKISR